MVHKIGFASNLLAPALTIFFLAISSLLVSIRPLSAHGGGVPQLTGELAGPYRIFVWTQPEPLRVGDIHLSIGVVKAAVDRSRPNESLDEPVTDATVTIHLLPVAQNSVPLQVPAILQEQLGSYYYEADATLPTNGDWRFTIEVSSKLGVGQAAFVATVDRAREINWLLIVAAGVVLLCLLGLIGLWNRAQAREKIT
jgi:hypothetical protein